MEKIPTYVHVIFLLTAIIILTGFFQATNRNKKVLIVLLGWTAIQVVLGAFGFFTVTDSIPPRLIVVILPPAIATIMLFNTEKGRKFIDNIDAKNLMLLHSARILVELIIFWLFLHKAMPRLMTFEGRNLDILSGLSAPLVYYFGFVKYRLGTKTLLGWNIVCLSILAITVVNGVLSAPTPFQRFGFDQPNIAVLYLPFILLPGLIVPIVYFSHLVTIRQLIRLLKNRPLQIVPISK